MSLTGATRAVNIAGPFIVPASSSADHVDAHRRGGDPGGKALTQAKSEPLHPFPSKPDWPANGGCFFLSLY